MQLILDTYGMSLSCKNQLFAIRGAEIEPVQIPVRDVSAIRVGKGVKLTSDAITLALENDICILFVNGAGMPQGHVWHGKFGSISTIRRKQLRFAESYQGMQWVQEGIMAKIQHQVAHAYSLVYAQAPEAQRKKLCRRIGQMEHTQQKLKEISILADTDLQRLQGTFRGLEGTASRHYFTVLAQCLPKNYQFKGRSGRGANDRFNAILNYLYGMLYGQVELALIQAGIDPHIGVLHVDQYNRPTMVYDFIEPYRIWAERVAVRLLFGQQLSHAHFTPHGNALWLAGTGKKRVIDGFVRFIEEKETHQGKQYIRERWLNLQAQQLAQKILNSV